jgi:hypothetical protein
MTAYMAYPFGLLGLFPRPAAPSKNDGLSMRC